MRRRATRAGGGRWAAGAFAAALALSACSGVPGLSVTTGSGSATGASSSAEATAIGTLPTGKYALAAIPPVGLVAIGHSGLTGYLTSDGQYTGVANSWATGTNPAVDSIYRRLRAVDPSVAAQVANTAVPGARVSFLPQQAINATTAVAHPKLAIIQTIGNDITCDGKDEANYPVFGQWLDATLSDLAHVSPQTKVLVLSNLGRPAAKAAAVAGNRSAKKHDTGSGACAFYNPAGRLQPANIARLTAITEHYEQVERSVCARFRQCHYDGGALARYRYRLSELVPGDWDHLDVAGQQKVAALIWPVVAKVLGIPS